MAHILLVEDDDMVRQTMEEILRLAGHETRPARNGREALEQCAESVPDLVVTDILMPEVEGVETVARLRALKPDLPIVAYSGGGRSEHFEFLDLAGRIGADRVLRKPILPRQLCEAVDAALARGETAPAPAMPPAAGPDE